MTSETTGEKPNDEGWTKKDQRQAPRTRRKVSTRRAVTEGINDPALYEQMSAPYPDVVAANEALLRFSVALRKLRAKHRIADVAFVASVRCETSDGVQRVATRGYNGSTTLEGGLYAWALGRVQADEAARLDAIRRTAATPLGEISHAK